MTFENMETVKITATLTNTTNKISFNGVTNDDNLTPETAQTQINKILAIVGTSVSTSGMTKTITQEAID